MDTKEKAMQRAIDLSRQGLTCGGPFGAVVVRGTEIIGEGVNLVVIRRDPTAHAEINAIRDACRFLKTHNLTGCDLYTSCEPCPMCMGAIRWARIGKVYYAADKLDADSAGFDDYKFYNEVVGPGISNLVEVCEAKDAARAVLTDWKTLPTKRVY